LIIVWILFWGGVGYWRRQLGLGVLVVGWDDGLGGVGCWLG